MAVRKPRMTRTFVPEDVRPGEPHLHVRRADDGAWELRSGRGQVLSTHPDQGPAVRAALSISRERYHEIFVESRNGRYLHLASQSPMDLLLVEIMQRNHASQKAPLIEY